MLVPQAVFAGFVHGAGDVQKMLEELAGDVLVGAIVFGQIEGEGQHVQAVHGHPTGAVGLFDDAAGGQRGGAIEDADVVEAEEASFEDVIAGGVFAIDPPGEVHQQLVKAAFEEGEVGFAVQAAVDLKDAMDGPGVDRRVDITEGPFVGRHLAVRVHVPFAQEELQLALGEARIDHRHRDHMESRIPGGIPGILPLVGHRNDVVVE